MKRLGERADRAGKNSGGVDKRLKEAIEGLGTTIGEISFLSHHLLGIACSSI